MYDLKIGDLFCATPRAKGYAWPTGPVGKRFNYCVGSEYYMVYVSYITHDIVHVLIGGALYILALDLFFEPTKIYRRNDG